MEQFRIQDSTPIYSLMLSALLLGKLIEHNISTGAYKKYYLFNGKLIALREGLGSTSTRRYLVTDHLGSLNTTLNLDGTVYSDLRYTPFGNQRWAINTSPTGARFTAQRLDDLLDLYNYNARYFDPAIGRFISADTLIPDPTNPQNFNRLSYVLNNPIRYTDPSGHCAEDEDQCTDYVQLLSEQYGLSVDFLTILTLEQLQFLFESLGLLGQINAVLPTLITNEINEAIELYELLTYLQNSSGWDVLGVRLDLSATGFLGIDGVVDFLFNFNSKEFSVFASVEFSIGAQAGTSFSGGVFLGFNAPSNDVYKGWGGSATLIGAFGTGVSLQFEAPGQFMPSDPSNDPWVLAVSYSSGIEAGVSMGGGYSWHIYTYDFKIDKISGFKGKFLYLL